MRTTTMSHRGGPDHDNATSSWLALPCAGPSGGRVSDQQHAVDVLVGRAVDVRAVTAVPGVITSAERDRFAGRADRDRPGVHEHPLDHAGAVRAAEMIGPGGQEQVEDLDQAAALD